MKLEDKIVKKVFVLETKKTAGEIFLRILGILVFAFVIFFIGSIIFEIFQEQRTLDLLEIFQEDIEIVRRYSFDVISQFYRETPKELVAILITGIVVILILLFNIARNFEKIRNKLLSIFGFWFKK